MPPKRYIFRIKLKKEKKKKKKRKKLKKFTKNMHGQFFTADKYILSVTASKSKLLPLKRFIFKTILHTKNIV